MEGAQQRALTDDELRDMRAVVDYSWAAEQRDFEEQDEDGRQNHIFNSLVVLDALLRDLVQ
ncbi:hypothetical protein [Streptacidiphilus jiangxiensis]|uniref:Uncharacterized protein n=1 Tax=Streptacidiphilus jiangxiensis TaxID=235985 RepID=A0A1H8BCT1_STRJI|nr:hypothetical protein [Streptacidiphilus jiangxiensis]SEM79914.1 hypothetical protein SAMN05414137_16013 [Streptacidiphilus jiangxiensis]